MPTEKEIVTQPVKGKKELNSKPQFQKGEFIVFLIISGVLVLLCAIFWGIFLNYYRNFIGASIDTIATQMPGSLKTILNTVRVVIGWPLIIFILLLDIFLLYISYRKSKRGFNIVWGLMIVFLSAGIGLSMGFHSAYSERINAANEQRLEQAALHFNLGDEALQNGNLELANVQFQYVSTLDPGFPGLVDKLVQVQQQINLKLTPTITPTPTIAPTPDTRSQDDIYAQILDNQNNGNWVEMFHNLEALRNIDPQYKALEMDGLYYRALRELAIQLINNGHLEEGIYDLNLAEKYAPLDRLAYEYRSWARNFINALAYWNVDWERVVNQLQVVASNLPNMRDANNLTSSWYYVHALINYADQYLYDACTAYTMYSNAQTVNYQYNVLTTDELTSLQTAIDDNL